MLTFSLSACAKPPNRLALAASEVGKAKAGIYLPALPGECRNAVPHAPAELGANAVVVLARERVQLDRANSVIQRCADHYDTLKSDLGAAR
jgi:hypothetical protein